jgi:hypothetical protein
MSFALDAFRDALSAYGQQDVDRALQLTQQAAQADAANAVYAAAVTYLGRVMREGKRNVYVSPEAFGAFIRGGGNVPLYANTSAALKLVYESYDSLSLLDIGVGDGLALLPALAPNIHHLDVLEPSLAMLNQTSAALNARGVEHRAINAAMQQLMQTALTPTLSRWAGEGVGWDVIQSTYALQSLQPEERPRMLAWLRAHCKRLLIVEFDAPDFQNPSQGSGAKRTSWEGLATPDRVRYFVEHYQRGLAEYADDGGLVAQGFLMPVFFGGFDPTEARVNWEMPIAEWVRLLRNVGFASVRTEPIYDYWWAPAYLVDAA